jgi:dethiobiotin synthetase
VVKPAQTGTAGPAPADVAEVLRLAAPATGLTLAEFPEPLAPLIAARVSGLPPLALDLVVEAVWAELAGHDLVLVEGAGGLLVPMGGRPDGAAWTVADLAPQLGAAAVVVARAGLGTLNHTALTLEALHRRAVPARVVLGAWPDRPGQVHWTNLGELLPVLAGVVPEAVGELEPGVFQRSAPGWLTPPLFGVLDDWRIWATAVER